MLSYFTLGKHKTFPFTGLSTKVLKEFSRPAFALSLKYPAERINRLDIIAEANSLVQYRRFGSVANVMSVSWKGDEARES